MQRGRCRLPRFQSRSFVPGAPTADQVKRAAEAFGAPGEDNGVGMGFGVKLQRTTRQNPTLTRPTGFCSI
jgi:hypothetical protein